MADIAELGYRVDSSQLKRATSELDQNTAAATRNTSATAKMEKQWQNAGKAIGVAIAAGITTGVVALKSSINTMDELSKAAQRVSMPTEEFSKLNYAAELADVSVGTLTQGLGLLTKSQAASLKETSKQAKVFAALKIDAIDPLTGSLRNSGDVLIDFADRFQAMKGSPEAMAAGFVLFGRSFQQLIPLLKDGGDGIREAGQELQAFGGVLSTEAGHNAEEFNDNLTRLETAARSLGLAVASDLLPDLVELSDQWVGMAKDGETLTETATELADAIRFAGDMAKFVWGYFDALGDVASGAAMGFVGFAEAAQGVINLDWDQIKRGMAVANQGADLAFYGEEEAARRNPGAYSNDSGSTDNSRSTGGRRGRSVTIREGGDQASVDAYTRKLQAALGGGGGGGGNKGRSGGKSDAQREVDQLEQSYQRMLAQLKEQAAMVGVVTEVERVRYQLNNGEMSKLSQGKKDEILALAQIADFRREDLENTQEAIKAEEEKQRLVDEATQAYEDTNQAILEQITLLGMTADEQEIWNNLAWAGVDAESARGKEITANTQLLQRMRTESEYQVEIMDSIRDAGKDIFVDIGNGVKPIDAIADAWERVRQKLLEMASEQLMDKIFGKQGDPAGGGGGGWLDAAMGLLGGIFGGSSGASSAAMTSGDFGMFNPNMGGFGGPRALGGDVRNDRMYQVGERNRPELLNMGGKQYLIPGDQGNVEPVRNRQRDRKSGNTYINIGVEGQVSRSTRAQIGGDVARSVRESTRNS